MKQTSKKSATGADAKKQADADAKAQSTAVTSSSMEQNNEISLKGKLRLTVVGARHKMFYLRMQVRSPEIANMDVLPEAGHGLVFNAMSAAVQIPLSVIETLQAENAWTFETWTRLAAPQLASGALVPLVSQDSTEHITALAAVKIQVQTQIASVVSTIADVKDVTTTLTRRKDALEAAANNDKKSEAEWLAYSAGNKTQDARDGCVAPLAGFLTIAECKPFGAYESYITAKTEYPEVAKAWQAETDAYAVDKEAYYGPGKKLDMYLKIKKKYEAADKAFTAAEVASCPVGSLGGMCLWHEQGTWTHDADKGATIGGGATRYIRFGRQGSGKFLSSVQGKDETDKCEVAKFGDENAPFNFPATDLKRCNIGRKCVKLKDVVECVPDSSVEEELLTGCKSEVAWPAAAFDALVEETVDERKTPETPNSEQHRARRALLAATQASTTQRALSGSAAAAAAAPRTAEAAPEETVFTAALETGEHRAGNSNYCGTEQYNKHNGCSKKVYVWGAYLYTRTYTCIKSRPRKCTSCSPGKTQMVQNVVRMCVCACVCVCFYGYACSRPNAESIRSQQRKEKRAGPADCSRTSRRRVSLCNPRPSLPFVMFVPSP